MRLNVTIRIFQVNFFPLLVASETGRMDSLLAILLVVSLLHHLFSFDTMILSSEELDALVAIP
jgi:hypothetical protein